MGVSDDVQPGQMGSMRLGQIDRQFQPVLALGRIVDMDKHILEIHSHPHTLPYPDVTSLQPDPDPFIQYAEILQQVGAVGSMHYSSAIQHDGTVGKT